ncbi:MAG: VWA domain-containing protein [Methanoregulaceae archaeon]
MGTYPFHLIILCGILCLIPGVAVALIPDQVLITSSSDWLVANGIDNTTLSVQAFNASNPLAGLTVDFSVNDSRYGSLDTTRKGTGSDGLATVTFRTGTTSGNVTLHALVTYSENNVTSTLDRTLIQKIDHDTPYQISNLEYPDEAYAGSSVPLVIRLKDKNGNPVDDKHVVEKIHLVVGSPEGTPDGGLAGFLNGSVYSTAFYAPVDANGNVSVTLKLATVSGSNVVWMEGIGNIPATYLTVTGVADPIPFSIDRTLSPSTGWQYADGEGTFEIDYAVRDKYGNGIRNTSLLITSPGESAKTLSANDAGSVSIIYGPKSVIGIYNISATAIDNTSVTCTDMLNFISTEATDMILTARPQTMASHDAGPDVVSDLMAKVIDIEGNPVEGETVTFQIVSTTNGTYNMTSAPSLDRTSALSDSDGYAIAHFTPGAFSTDTKDPLYNQTATGSSIVRATWNNVTADITLTWKNYPYLSVVTIVSPSTVAVNDTVSIIIRLTGDGSALEPNPIDVMLVMDRSGSMGYDYPTRMSSAQTAAKTFVDQMNVTRDRVGLVSFASSTTLDQSLTNDFSRVKMKIGRLDPYGATQLRNGAYLGISRVNSSSESSESVKAVVIMTDGDWNYDGSPLAHGTGWPANASYTFSGSTFEPNNYRYYDGLGGTLAWISNNWRCTDGEFTNQNLSRYARAGTVRLYTISFASTLDDVAVNALRVMANATGGFYSHAPDAAGLLDIYTKIAGDLKTEAGVNTTMNINFGTISVNNQSFNGTEVFAYVHQVGVSSRIDWPNGSVTTVDQTANWTKSQNLDFDVGTVKLNEVWQATIQFKVLKAGNIDVFGNNSQILFNNGTDSLVLPKTYLTAVPVLNNTGVNFVGLTLSDLKATVSSPTRLSISWDFNYTGTQTATEKVYYSTDEGQSWKSIVTLTRNNGYYSESADLDLTQATKATEFYIRIDASGLDGGWDREETLVATGNQTNSFIKLE